MSIKPSVMAFVDNYQDGSGIEFCVCWNRDKDQEELRIAHGGMEVFLPKDRFEWLLACLDKIAQEQQE